MPITRACLERVMLHGVLPGHCHPRRAAHPPGASKIAAREGPSARTLEFQMLFGVRRDLQFRLVRDGFRVRIYLPYGREWYPYLVRRLAEQQANVGFFVRTLVQEALAGERTVVARGSG